MDAERTVWPAVDALFAQTLGEAFPAAALEVCKGGNILYAQAYGVLDPEAPAASAKPVTLQTRFDLASVTKLFVVTTFMTYVEQGRVGLDSPVRSILPEFSGLRPIAPQIDPLQIDRTMDIVPPTNARVDAGQVTFRNLLAHNSGLPAWLPLFSLATRDDMYATALNTAFAYPIGEHVVYSDIGLILVGLAVERISGMPLDAAVYQCIREPLGLTSLHYSPVPCDDTAPTRAVYTPELLCGLVHDDNARGLGGVAGHAGLFANVHDLAEFGETYRRGGGPLLHPETVAEMTTLQAADGADRRGIGFVLWSPDPEATIYPYSPSTYGHTGFTGTSLWIDPERELVIALLTNRVYYGSSNRTGITTFRRHLAEILIAA